MSRLLSKYYGGYMAQHVVMEGQMCKLFNTKHLIVRVESGMMQLTRGLSRTRVCAGETVFLRKEANVVGTCVPGNNGEPFKGTFIVLTKWLLNEYKKTIKPRQLKGLKWDPVATSQITLKDADALFEEANRLLDSQPQMEAPEPRAIASVAEPNGVDDSMLPLLLKICDDIVATDPELMVHLFDFDRRFHPDIKMVMDLMYRKDAELPELAYLSGRSLSTFKREFFNIFGQTPSRWITMRRLQEAQSLIEKGYHPSEACIVSGFKNVTHFYRCFKEVFGKSPAEYNDL